MVNRPTVKMSRRRNRKVKTSKKKTVAKALAKVKDNHIKKIVNKMIHRNVETKQASLQLLNANPVPGGGLSLTGTPTAGIIKYTVIPVIPQGTAINQRLGDKLKPQTLQIRGFVKSLEYDLVTNNNTRPFYAHIWLVLDKRYRLPYTTSGTNNLLDISDFKRNANDPVPFDGSVINAILPYNTDTYKVLAHRRIKLDSMSPTTVYGSSTPFTTAIMDSVNNGCSYAKAFNIKIGSKHLPKQFSYDEDLRNAGAGILDLPTNYNPYLFVALQNMDGTLSSSTQSRFSIYAESVLYYEDA